MSTFGGKLLETSLNAIRIDNFEENNLDGKYFFLSHSHTDHMKGIFSEEFSNELINNGGKMLFCSSLTRRYLLNNEKCKIPKNKIFSIGLNAPYILFMMNHPHVEVTLIPAGHCPGSVMIYMVQAEMRVLYTGDFRVNKYDLRNYRVFTDKHGNKLPMHNMYLDTTFCDPNWLTFPDRITTNDDILELILDWVLDNPKHEVGLWYISHHGLESLLVQLAVHKLLKTKIWIIDHDSFANYACIPELHDKICRLKCNAKIHICPVKTKGNCFVCQSNREDTLTIKPVAMSFNQQQLLKGRTIREGQNLVKVAYSTHCSLEELIDAYNFFQPQKVVPCVVRTGLTDEQVLQNLQLGVEKFKELKIKEGNKENKPESNLNSPPSKRCCYFEKQEGAETSDPNSPVVIKDITDEPKIKEEDVELSLSQSEVFGMDSPPF